MINDISTVNQIQSVQPQNPVAQQTSRDIAKPKEDRFDLSAEARRLMREGRQEAEGTKRPTQVMDRAQLNSALSEEERQQLLRLQARDTEVRTHEQAHVAAGGGLTGKPTYTEQRGPDGKMYATGGQVEIDTSKAETPEKTIEKARIIRSAAMAPAQPSPEDYRIAAYAEQMEAEARLEMEQMFKQNQSQNPDGTLKPGFSIKA